MDQNTNNENLNINNVSIAEDDEVILNGYTKLKECIEDFRDVLRKTNAVREYCSKEHFSVGEFSYEDAVDRCCTSLQEMINKLDEFAELLVSVVDQETFQMYKARNEAALIKENAATASTEGTEFSKALNQ